MRDGYTARVTSVRHTASRLLISLAAVALVVGVATATGVPAGAGSARAAEAPAGSATERSVPEFRGTQHRIDRKLRAAMIASGSWKPGCPVGFSDLRLIKVSYWGFDRSVHLGKLVVHRTEALDLISVFRKLYAARFKFRQIRLIDAFGASDRASMRADNTSAFNGRYVSGTTRWSMHAYGLAIDINPVENPYVSGSYVSPANGAPYMDRSRRAMGMIHAGDVVVRAFRSIGWKWGGYWSGAKDYQHFSSNGG